eukprot:403232-Lingulodinium_polyedra.AAC.1
MHHDCANAAGQNDNGAAGAPPAATAPLHGPPRQRRNRGVPNGPSRRGTYHAPPANKPNAHAPDTNP